MKLIGVKAGSVLIKGIGKKKKVLNDIKPLGVKISEQIPTSAVFGSSVRRLCLDFVSQCGVSFKKKIEKYEIEILDKQRKQRDMIEQGIEQQAEQVQKGIVEMYYYGVALLISVFIASVYWEEDMEV
ncbi:MAG: hypothetical protein EZS28_038830 [Streblomastix strix]|uniref:Uncharacterized protein n=1 Tax=Streblomastix strix TaxID=222440 RepID=A0A5J4U647_9EUKA|nr:MAG: hypothetical protein EZS28_038830 [Streblomastix strix]